MRQKENVEFIWNSVVKQLLGEPMLTALEVQDVQTKEIREIEVSGVFIAIGQMPDNEPFANYVKLDEKGYIEAAEDCNTETPGVYVAGDCRTKSVRQLATAAADGAVAALAACEYME